MEIIRLQSSTWISNNKKLLNPNVDAKITQSNTQKSGKPKLANTRANFPLMITSLLFCLLHKKQFNILTMSAILYKLPKK